MEEEIKFYLKKPDGKSRKSFSLVCYKPISRTKKEYVEAPQHMRDAVKNINKQLKEETITKVEAQAVLDELIESEYRKSKVPAVALKYVKLSSANAKVLRKFWNEVYEVKYLEDPASTKGDFERAFRAIEPLAIQSSSQADLQKALQKNLQNTGQVRRASSRLNEVLKYIKRGFKLRQPKKPKKKVKHLTKDDFIKAHKHIACPDCKNLAMALFASGMRIGESMAAEPEDFFDGQLLVDKQIEQVKKELKDPKREKKGDVAVFDFGADALEAWLEVEDKWAHRYHFNKYMVAACATAGVAKVTAHALRHSHAIHLLSLGATLTDVSLNLRNRIEVCQEYYTGYAHSEGTLDRLKKFTKPET